MRPSPLRGAAIFAASAGLAALAACADPLAPAASLAPDLAPVAAIVGATTAPAVSNLVAASGRRYEAVAGGLASGAAQYVDRAFTLGTVPAPLAGAMLIRTANDDKVYAPGSASILAFDVAAPAVVYVALDPQLPRPSWMGSAWTDTGLDLPTSDHGKTFTVFRREVAAGRVTLGSNVDAARVSSMYIVGVAGVATDSGAAPLPAPAPGGIAKPAELPRTLVDTRMPAVTGRVIRPLTASALQAAIDTARLGDAIELQAGRTYSGSFVLRRKSSGAGWITLRSSALASLPAEGGRVGPAHAGLMPRLESPTSGAPVLRTDRGAGNYRLVGLMLAAPTAVTSMSALVSFHVSAPGSVADFPHHLVIDRSYVLAHPALHLQRCILLNAATSAVIDSYVEGCHHGTYDSQAILAWDTPGPLKIVNNYLQGAGENVMFGGARASLTDVMPSDIELRRNHFHKPLSWQQSGKWAVKNLFEIKFARRVLVEANVFENHWVDAQAGPAILWKVSQDGAAWVRTEDITFRDNVVKNVPGAFNIAGGGTMPTARISIRNNLITGVGARSLGGFGRAIQLLGGIADVDVSANTVLFAPTDAVRAAVVMMDGRGVPGVSIRQNVLELGDYGVFASGAGQGSAGLTAFASSWEFTGNALLAPSARPGYPTGNLFATLASAGFVNRTGGDYRLTTTSPLRALPVVPGADVDRVLQATAGVAR